MPEPDSFQWFKGDAAITAATSVVTTISAGAKPTNSIGLGTVL